MKYPYSVYKSEVEGHVFWVAESNCLQGCVGQGDTLDTAVSVLEDNEFEWIATAEEIGMPIPEIATEKLRAYSGKLTLRVSPTVHQKAAELAKKEGVSLNQYLNDAVVSYNAEMSTGRQFVSQFKDTLCELRSLFFGAQTSSRQSSVLSLQLGQQSAYKFAPSHVS